VVNDIDFIGEDISEFGLIFHKCNVFFSQFPNFNVKFFRMQTNMVEHVLVGLPLVMLASYLIDS